MSAVPVTIVVPVFNDAATLAPCVRSVLALTQYPDWELIVVDDASTDGGLQTLRGIEGIKVFKKKSRTGAANTLNAGASAAPGRDIVRLHADVVIETPDWLTKLAEAAAERPDAAVIGVRLLYPNGLIQSEGRSIVSGFGLNPPHPECKAYQTDRAPGPVREVDSVCGALAYIRREAFNRVGGFDELYGPTWFDDDDLCMAVRHNGYRVYVHPGVKAVHYTRSCPPFMRAFVNDRSSALWKLTRGLKEKANHIQAERWEAKWGWNPYHPDISEIRRLYGDTPICWQIGEPLRYKPSSEYPTVDCCLVTWNCLPLLRRTLETLAATDYPAEQIQVYIANNGSTDGTADYLASLAQTYPFRLHSINLPLNTGVSAGLDHAIIAGRGELVARLDDDIRLPPQWLKMLVADLRCRPFAGCAGGKTVNDDDRAALQWSCHYVHPDYYNARDETNLGQSDQLARVFHAPGCCNLYRREVFSRAGLVDVRFAPTQYDDIDHHFALFHAGYEVLYDGRVTIVHKRMTGLDRSVPGITNSNANRSKMIGKWGPHCHELVEKALLFSREGRTLPFDGDTSALLARAPAPSEFPRKAPADSNAIRLIVRIYEELNGRGDAGLAPEKLSNDYILLAGTEVKLSSAIEAVAVSIGTTPTHLPTFQKLAELFHRSGETGQGVLIAQRGLHLYPNDPVLVKLAKATWADFAPEDAAMATPRGGLRLPEAAASAPAAVVSSATLLRVLMVHPFQPRSSMPEVTLLEQCAGQLRKVGVNVDICRTACPDPRGYDIVHFWNAAFPYQTIAQMKSARVLAPNIPRVLTPLHANSRGLAWDIGVMKELCSNGLSHPRVEKDFLQLAAGKLLLNGLPRPTAAHDPFDLTDSDTCLKKAMELVHLVLPSSQDEIRDLNTTAGVRPPHAIIPSAADPGAFDGVEAESFVKRYKVKDFVLAVGPVEPRGNQLMLVLAARTTKLPLVIAGQVADFGYGRNCRDLAPAGTIFLPEMRPEEYAAALKAARVFIDPSWAPFSAAHAIEAGMAGCSLVLSNRLLEKAPFGSEACWVNPASILALRNAISAAHSGFAADAPKRSSLKKRLMEGYTWKQAIESLLGAYNQALAGKSQAPFPA